MSRATPTVFVVDDEALVRKALARLLRSAGYRVAVFSSALEFLEKTSSESPGCLVLDVAMPEMSGLELQQVLKMRDTSWPIIFVSGQDYASISLEARNQDSVSFFIKPVDDEILLATVARAIQKDRMDRIARLHLSTSARRAAVNNSPA